MSRKPKVPVIVADVPEWAQCKPVNSGKALLARSVRSIEALRTPTLCRIDEAAVILRVSSKTVRRLVARGDLRAVRIGRLVRIQSSEIDRLIAGRCPSEADFTAGEDHA